MLSVKHKAYENTAFDFQKNGESGVIENIFSYNRFLQWLLGQKEADVKYIFEHYRYPQRVCFPLVNDRCYAAEAIQNNELNRNDKVMILENISRLIASIQKGGKTRFWDSLGNGIFEYRISVSKGEFRLIFFQKNAIYFLNGFIKKQAQTPKREIERAEKLKREVEKTL